jgi:hypothetical protein
MEARFKILIIIRFLFKQIQESHLGLFVKSILKSHKALTVSYFLFNSNPENDILNVKAIVK